MTEIREWYDVAGYFWDGIDRKYFVESVRTLDGIWLADHLAKMELKQKGMNPVTPE